RSFRFRRIFAMLRSLRRFYRYLCLHSLFLSLLLLFFFNDTPTTQIYTLSLHDALPISCEIVSSECRSPAPGASLNDVLHDRVHRSEEHTSELQSRENLVCRLLLEKKKKKENNNDNIDKIAQKNPDKSTEDNVTAANAPA